MLGRVEEILLASAPSEHIALHCTAHCGELLLCSGPAPAVLPPGTLGTTSCSSCAVALRHWP